MPLWRYTIVLLSHTTSLCLWSHLWLTPHVSLAFMKACTCPSSTKSSSSFSSSLLKLGTVSSRICHLHLTCISLKCDTQALPQVHPSIMNFEISSVSFMPADSTVHGTRRSWGDDAEVRVEGPNHCHLHWISYNDVFVNIIAKLTLRRWRWHGTVGGWWWHGTVWAKGAKRNIWREDNSLDRSMYLY